jgi:predicted DNA-binding WGR domain protein
MEQRKLQFVEGTSSKFWHATLEQLTLTVCFGRIGTQGQTQAKTFASGAEAKKTYDEQVAEKLKKGYLESTGAAAPSAPVAAAVPPAPKPRARAVAASAPDTPDEPMPAQAPTGAATSASGSDTAYQRPPVRIRGIRAAESERLRMELAAPLPWPEPIAFDRARCIEGLRRVAKADNHSFSLREDHPAITLTMSREEARLYVALLQERGTTNVGEFVKRVEQGPLPEPGENILGAYTESNSAILLCRALGLEATLELMFSPSGWYNDRMTGPLRVGVGRDLLPYLDEPQREALRQRLRAELAANAKAAWAVALLAQLGEGADQQAERIRAWPDGSCDRGSMADGATIHALLGLRDPAAIASEARRLKVHLYGVRDARLLLAATELRCLDLFARAALSPFTKTAAAALAGVLALVEAPENAPHMLQLLLESSVPGVAREWLDQHPEFAAEGLTDLASGNGAKAEAAREQLRLLYKRGLTHCVDAALNHLPEVEQRALREKLETKREAEHALLQESELPEWAQRCFGDPEKLLVAPVVLTPEQLAPVRRIALERPALAYPAVPEPEVLPAAPLFDLEVCMARLLSSCRQATFGSGNWYAWDDALFDPELPLAREEAMFWAAARKVADYRSSPAKVEKALRAMRFDAAFANKLAKGTLPVPIAYVLYGLQGLVGAFPHDATAESEMAGVLQRVVRFLSVSARAELLSVLLATPEPSAGSLYLALCIGATKAQLREPITRIPEAHLKNWMHVGLRLLYVLEEPDAILAQAERIGVVPWDAATTREWLAFTGLAGVPSCVRSLPSSKLDKAELLRGLTVAETPEVAAPMLAMRKLGSVRETVRRWFEAHPVLAIEGLLPFVGTKDKLAEPAVDYLRDLARRGYGAVIAQKSVGDPRVKKLILDPRAGLATPNDNDHILCHVLPRIVVTTAVGARSLTPVQVATVLAELRSSSLGAPTPRLSLLREHLEQSVRDAFVWSILQGWLRDGGPPKDRWKLEAVGQLGGDASALKLAALIRTWPGEGQHQRAVLGLEVLRAIGSDTALMQIHGISQKVSFKGIKERAAECLDGIAEDRGMTRDELADRIIPDAGLSDNGTRVFDFGPRKFTFFLGTDLKPMLRDEAGKRSTDLPKPNSKDDAALAAEAVAGWKLLKKQVADVAKTQSTRLELAMVVGRRWTADEFRSLFLAHPLMIHLLRRLIWGAYDHDASLRGTFRVGEDNTLSDAKDQPWELTEQVRAVGLVHPSHLGESERASWGELLSDYEIIPPFAQLGRPTFALSESERGARLLRRFGAHSVDPKVLVFGLEAMGWQRGQPQDGGGFCAHHKRFGDVTAVVTYRDGCWVGSTGDDWSRQTIEALGFVRDAGQANDGFFAWTRDESNALPLSEIEAVIRSEALYDVTRLYERGKPA